jgi:hypothetical protein
MAIRLNVELFEALMGEIRAARAARLMGPNQIRVFVTDWFERIAAAGLETSGLRLDQHMTTTLITEMNELIVSQRLSTRGSGAILNGLAHETEGVGLGLQSTRDAVSVITDGNQARRIMAEAVRRTLSTVHELQTVRTALRGLSEVPTAEQLAVDLDTWLNAGLYPDAPYEAINSAIIAQVIAPGGNTEAVAALLTEFEGTQGGLEEIMGTESTTIRARAIFDRIRGEASAFYDNRLAMEAELREVTHRTGTATIDLGTLASLSPGGLGAVSTYSRSLAVVFSDMERVLARVMLALTERSTDLSIVELNPIIIQRLRSVVGEEGESGQRLLTRALTRITHQIYALEEFQKHLGYLARALNGFADRYLPASALTTAEIRQTQARFRDALRLGEIRNARTAGVAFDASLLPVDGAASWRIFSIARNPFHITPTTMQTLHSLEPVLRTVLRGNPEAERILETARIFRRVPDVPGTEPTIQELQALAERRTREAASRYEGMGISREGAARLTNENTSINDEITAAALSVDGDTDSGAGVGRTLESPVDPAARNFFGRNPQDAIRVLENHEALEQDEVVANAFAAAIDGRDAVSVEIMNEGTGYIEAFETDHRSAFDFILHYARSRHILRRVGRITRFFPPFDFTPRIGRTAEEIDRIAHDLLNPARRADGHGYANLATHLDEIDMIRNDTRGITNSLVAGHPTFLNYDPTFYMERVRAIFRRSDLSVAWMNGIVDRRIPQMLTPEMPQMPWVFRGVDTPAATFAIRRGNRMLIDAVPPARLLVHSTDILAPSALPFSQILDNPAELLTLMAEVISRPLAPPIRTAFLLDEDIALAFVRHFPPGRVPLGREVAQMLDTWNIQAYMSAMIYQDHAMSMVGNVLRRESRQILDAWRLRGGALTQVEETRLTEIWGRFGHDGVNSSDGTLAAVYRETALLYTNEFETIGRVGAGQGIPEADIMMSVARARLLDNILSYDAATIVGLEYPNWYVRVPFTRVLAVLIDRLPRGAIHGAISAIGRIMKWYMRRNNSLLRLIVSITHAVVTVARKGGLFFATADYFTNALAVPAASTAVIDRLVMLLGSTFTTELQKESAKILRDMGIQNIPGDSHTALLYIMGLMAGAEAAPEGSDQDEAKKLIKQMVKNNQPQYGAINKVFEGIDEYEQKPLEERRNDLLYASAASGDVTSVMTTGIMPFGLGDLARLRSYNSIMAQMGPDMKNNFLRKLLQAYYWTDMSVQLGLGLAFFFVPSIPMQIMGLMDLVVGIPYNTNAFGLSDHIRLSIVNGVMSLKNNGSWTRGLTYSWLGGVVRAIAGQNMKALLFSGNITNIVGALRMFLDTNSLCRKQTKYSNVDDLINDLGTVDDDFFLGFWNVQKPGDSETIAAFLKDYVQGLIATGSYLEPKMLDKEITIEQQKTALATFNMHPPLPMLCGIAALLTKMPGLMASQYNSDTLAFPVMRAVYFLLVLSGHLQISTATAPGSGAVSWIVTAQ